MIALSTHGKEPVLLPVVYRLMALRLLGLWSHLTAASGLLPAVLRALNSGSAVYLAASASSCWAGCESQRMLCSV